MDIKDVENLRDNILWLQQRMPYAMKRWQDSKPNCEYNSGLIKDICYRPGIIVGEVFDPAIKWLSDYIETRQGRLKIGNVDDFLKVGLYRIFRFVTVADFFAKNPSYFVPYTTFTDLNRIKTENDYRDFLNLLMGKLIGCNEKMNFIFIKLMKTVPKVTEEMKQMQTYLENQCVFLKVRALER